MLNREGAANEIRGATDRDFLRCLVGCGARGRAGGIRPDAAAVRDAGWEPANVDCSVVCEAPKLAPHRLAMEGRLSDAVGAPVTVKGRRPEGLGALGRGEGIACFAVALVQRAEGER